MNDSSFPAIYVENLVKRYGSGPTAVDALKGVSMAVSPGEVVGLIGPSGSGKTTMLQCLGAVLEPTAGKIMLGSRLIYDQGWKHTDLRTLRRDYIGFIFQAAYLIPFLSAIDNVALLPMLAGKRDEQARKQAADLLEILEVSHRSHAKVSQLSGGEQQRIAIARALVNRPAIVLADEPTAALDTERSIKVIKLLNMLAEQYQTAIIVVTHDDMIIPSFKRLYRMRDGLAYEELGQGQAI